MTINYYDQLNNFRRKHLEINFISSYLQIKYFNDFSCDDQQSSCSQFHQHFMCAFLYESLLFAWSLALNELSYKKCARKMLMKLTPDGEEIDDLQSSD